MIFIEPQQTFMRRQAQQTIPPPRPKADDFWTSIVFDILKEDGTEPMRFTTLVNMTAKRGNFSRWKDYDACKRKIFNLVGNLVRIGRLDRVNRRFVIIPKSDARYRAYQESLLAPLDLPMPLV